MANSIFTIRCDNKIELGNGVVVYCVLQGGHEGKCQPDPSFVEHKPTRCQALRPDTKQQCGLPNGHSGQHRNGNAVLPW